MVRVEAVEQRINRTLRCFLRNSEDLRRGNRSIGIVVVLLEEVIQHPVGTFVGGRLQFAGGNDAVVVVVEFIDDASEKAGGAVLFADFTIVIGIEVIEKVIQPVGDFLLKDG